MKSLLSVKSAAVVCATVLFCFTITSWQEGTPAINQNTRDTVPAKTGKTKDLDHAIADLENAKADLEKSIKEIDWEKMNAELKEAMKSMDQDLKEMNADLKKSLQEIDVEKMKQEVETSVAKIDWDKIKTEIEKVKDINTDSLKANLQEVQQNLGELQQNLQQKLQESHKQIEKANVEMQAYKTSINGLERDGLIQETKGYKLEHKDGKLYINGTLQSSDVYQKYKQFLEKNTKFTIQKTDDGFTINND